VAVDDDFVGACRAQLPLDVARRGRMSNAMRLGLPTAGLRKNASALARERPGDEKRQPRFVREQLRQPGRRGSRSRPMMRTLRRARRAKSLAL